MTMAKALSQRSMIENSCRRTSRSAVASTPGESLSPPMSASSRSLLRRKVSDASPLPFSR